ncbi:hypothetical protein CJ030_MR5G009627 [Morella rubra]|uniref:Uncharacterized protein n=1 Tax=Morella rubra TaxID=262757 RepID=A0A6A1VND0_9ROSI|nr:hypothetical protein CJ030_MR5G009627 [Morella rubra]
MAERSAGFYTRFDTVVEVAKDKFPSVDLSVIKAEDYAEEIGAEVGSPLVVEVPAAEFGKVNPEAVMEVEGTNMLVPTSMTGDSPSLVLGISLSDPPVVAVSLASIDQAALSPMVVSGGGLEGQTTPTLQGKEATAIMEEDVGGSFAVDSGS